jgi:hypothetical protein
MRPDIMPAKVSARTANAPACLLDRIYVLCHARDLWLAKISVASIRHWYPDMPMTLIKDRTVGDFDTSEMERCWNLSSLVLAHDRCGLGFAKIELLLRPRRERFLVLDADTVMCGPVLRQLEQFTDDFVVPGPPIDNPRADSFKSIYFDLDRLLELDPEFRFSGYAFNTGVFVGTSGILTRKIFDPHLKWSSPIELKAPEIFSCADQGVLNYVLMKLAAKTELTLRSGNFMMWGFSEEAKQLDVRRIASGRGYDTILHYAGAKPRSIIEFPAAPILLHFDRVYLQSVAQV